MRKIIAILVLCVFCFQNLIAQTKIETNERMDGVWSETRNEWDIVNKNEDDTTYFEFKENFTFLTHKTASAVSIYKLNLEKYNNEHNHFNFNAISDSGNQYNMIVDYENRRIKFIYKDEYERTRIVQHHIKDLTYVD